MNSCKKVWQTYQNCRKLDPILSSSSGEETDLALVPLWCGTFKRPKFLETGRGTLVVGPVVVFIRG